MCNNNNKMYFLAKYYKMAITVFFLFRLQIVKKGNQWWGTARDGQHSFRDMLKSEV